LCACTTQSLFAFRSKDLKRVCAILVNLFGCNSEVNFERDANSVYMFWFGTGVFLAQIIDIQNAFLS
jgi:hypothetical protein